MASDILHIKDAYFFEIPHVLWKSNRTAIADFPEHYIRLDPVPLRTTTDDRLVWSIIDRLQTID